MRRVLWVSRHRPLKAQVEALRRAFGEVEISIHDEQVKDVDHLLGLIRRHRADEVVCVLPVSIIMRLVERGWRPLWSEMELLHRDCEGYGCPEYGADSDVIMESPSVTRHYRFREFRRILRFEMVTEPI